MPNKLFNLLEASTTWRASGGNKVLDLASLATNEVSQLGHALDLGSASRPYRLSVEMLISGFTSNPAAADVGRPVILYFARSAVDLSEWDGRPDTAPGLSTLGTLASTAGARRDALPNLLRAVMCFCRSTTAADELRARRIIEIADRYVSPVVHNTCSVGLANNTNHKIVLHPAPLELQ